MLRVLNGATSCRSASNDRATVSCLWQANIFAIGLQETVHPRGDVRCRSGHSPIRRTRSIDCASFNNCASHWQPRRSARV